MRPLLFDQNLSPHLVEKLGDHFPDCLHVETIGLGASIDRVVWDYAREQDCVIVTKDADYSELGLVLGFPPKVIWIRRGNCSTDEIEVLLREHRDAIAAFSDDSNSAVLTLF